VYSVTIQKAQFPQFFITAPGPCPYLPGRLERKVFTHLIGTDARQLNSQLSHTGFRRSQNISYRPACDACQACVSVRVPVQGYSPTQSLRRVLQQNTDISSRVVSAVAKNEHYSLFRDYVDTRHSDGGMADMTVLDFAAMIDDSVVDSRLIEFRKGATSIDPGELVGACLIDVLGDGISMIYSFYNPTLPKRSLGTYMVLDTIARARKLGMNYLYLGYWIDGSSKMGYKSRFLPQERLTADGWTLHKS
jgi:leucyl-tRNA---protein transferase